ncbi:MAG: HNH endonuclease [Candidatus Competibacteraceae bacterium]|uniref:HNH nuclease domain-containing protein n=1 Tax=Candidatus Contendobacter odensis Run_B_J11 TaxID=1400861 RepID=A0A7U7J2K2_9GAMM|nr:HNH endonuclease signature motif containing protein [Candidatus Contendobacter odensis]MBK8535265.1 HNH endonuclease [Candidatus Competibacteraceae bacterium]CDH43254.1 hypothetical protein BN874_1110004 [Candidatus Contendobacter odensis Run_B_J11]
MRIALRTSGGRGEYEVAGSHGSITVSDIIDFHIQLQMLPNQFIDTNNYIRRVQGKPRIRLSDQKQDQHIYLTIADILLMPKPKRELSKTPGGKLQLTENNYSISSIQFDIIKKGTNLISIQPTDIVLENSDRDLARIDILERLRIILDVWGRLSTENDELSNKIKNHKIAIFSGNIRNVIISAGEIRKLFDINDPLKEILIKYNIISEYSYWMGVHREDVELSIIEEDLTNPREAAMNRIKRWRLQASRGSKGDKFSREVKAVYNNKCLFTGYYLPKSIYFNTSGVDSAHILPWAEYDLNSVSNGLCLSKLCHWAFDSGILVLKPSSSSYELSISEAALQAEKEGMISLEGFKLLEGKIPTSRLPADKKNWPSPYFIEQYNQSFML